MNKLMTLAHSVLMLTMVVAASCAAVAISSDASHAQSRLEQIKERGFVRVGFANEAPFGYATASGKLTGEAPEVA